MTSLKSIALCALISLSTPLRSQTIESLPGRTVERATAGEDTSQAFAVYYPSGYSEASKWPLLFVMDPRGRAMVALRLFAPAAEKHGFVVVSSYNTLSDGEVEPNIGAANAMLTAAQTTIAADMTRLYIAGFSGTARIAWSIELEAPKIFGGILSAGAAPIFNDSAGSRGLLHAPGFAIALTTGTMDFNAAEVRRARSWLRSERVPVRVEEYAGPHSWPPAPLIEHALAWFRLRGMLGGRWPMDSAWVKLRLTEEAKRADSIAALGKLLDAAEIYEDLDELAGSFAGSDFGARAKELAMNPAVLSARKRLIEFDTRYLSRKAQMSVYFATIDAKDAPPTREEIIRALDITGLKKMAAESDSLEKQWAQRMLSLVGVMLGFYQPRTYLDLKRPLQAISMLEASSALAPLGPGQCAMLSQALAGLTDDERRKLEEKTQPLSASCGGT
ncbi:MAG TPA: hypothetical protein VM099_08885 [Gemmatimonadaceae bacterium]|nr:hypothetical protein [Gemmatimonadaceae bacterium]